MSELFVHAGSMKTGSSYLQHVFAINEAQLLQNRMEYPQATSSNSCNHALHGRISSGNGHLVTDSRLPREPDAGVAALYSREMLYFELMTVPSKLQKWKHFGEKFSKVHVLYVVRDPFEWLASSWIQRIKRGGEQRTLEEYWSAHQHEVSRLEDFIYVADELGWDMTLRTYSRDTINGDVIDWLGAYANGLEWPTVTVNRTLTFAEVMMVRAFFPVYGDCVRKLADRLCNELPDIVGYKPTITSDCRFEDDTVASIERLNAILLEHGQPALRTHAQHPQPENMVSFLLGKPQRRIVDDWLKNNKLS